MKSNYKLLGEYIREVNVRNVELKDLNLLGISIQKEFIPSIANTIGTDMSKYKIVKKNQFAYGTVTSRNGDKISIALLQNYDEALISQAYISFEVIDENILLPEYLMMWFSRTEFDRYARYMSYGSAREVFSWEEMCNVKLPIPTIEKQIEIVKEYNTILNRIKLNENIINKLEELSQIIFKQLFMEIEFSDKENNKHKKSEGIFKYNNYITKNILREFYVGNLEDLVEIIDGDRGKNYPSKEEICSEGFCLFLNAGNVTDSGFKFRDNSFISKEKDELLRKGKLQRNDVVITSRGTVGNVGYYSDIIPFENIRINSGMVILRAKKIKECGIFTYMLLRSDYMKRIIGSYLSGSAQQQLPIKDLVKIPIIVPNDKSIIEFAEIAKIYQNHIDLKKVENENLIKLKDLILRRMSK